MIVSSGRMTPLQTRHRMIVARQLIDSEFVFLGAAVLAQSSIRQGCAVLVRTERAWCRTRIARSDDETSPRLLERLPAGRTGVLIKIGSIEGDDRSTRNRGCNEASQPSGDRLQ